MFNHNFDEDLLKIKLYNIKKRNISQFIFNTFFILKFDL